jgi:hypothetical protein
MDFKRIRFHCFVLGIAAAVFSIHAQSINITGTIKNQYGKGISGATVSLKNAKIAATTKTDGTYAMTNNPVAYFPSTRSQVNQTPWLDKTNVCFNVTEQFSKVRIAAFDLQGRSIATVQNGLLKKGSYALNPFLQKPASGMYFISVDIDNSRTLFKTPLFPFARPGISQKVIDKSTPLGKKAAAVDTLSVSAAGYEPVLLDIPQYTGAYDFTLNNDYNISYYRLRIEYSSTGDWTGLNFQDSTDIFKTRIMTSSGTPSSISADYRHITLNQSPAGNTVAMTVDLALKPEALDTIFSMQLSKGSAGKVDIKVSSVIGTTVTLIKEVNQAAGLTFTVDLSSFKNTPLSKAPIAPVRKMIWAYYYPWYYLSSWTSTQLADHPSTAYSSNDTVAIARQIDQAQAGGIDGFLCSWWGPDNTYDDNNLKLLCKVAQKKNFSVGILLETMNDTLPRDSAQLVTWLTYFITTYRNYPAMFKINNNPLIMPWCSNLIPLAKWKNIFAVLHAQGLDATVLEDGYNLDYLTAFYGMTNYSNYAEKNLLMVEAPAARNARYYTLLADSGTTPRLFMATVQPGYDERLLPGRTARYQPRDSGNFYRSMLGPAVQCDPTWIVISTWNEFWENTHVEPSALYGTLYTQITLEYSNMWKK